MAQWVKAVAQVAAMAQVGSLAQEFPCAVGVARKKNLVIITYKEKNQEKNTHI